ncbi:MAG: TonB-dependent receptor [Pseudomonadota bacterium]
MNKSSRLSPSAGYFSVFLASASALAVAGASQAAAQEAEASRGLDEITVTAQRREENQQDVPISLTTLPGDRLDTILQNAEDIRALGTRVPGLYAESSNGRVAPRFYIRGLGNTDFDLAASQPVSIIMDEIVQENVVLKSFPLFDIERVEVLRGPQGTLFGRNTPAGIIKFDTVKPGDEMEGYISGSLGRFFTRKVEGALGGPLIEDKLGFRISLLHQGRNNWIDNGTTGEENALGGFDEYAGRLQLLWTPTDNIETLLNFHGRDIDGTSAVFRANILGPGDNELNANFDRDVVFFDGGDNNPQSYSNYGGSAKIAIDFGAATVTSITGYETAEGSSRGDIDGGTGAVFLPTGSFPGTIPFPSDTTDGLDDLDQFTQEVRIASNDSGPFNWQAGFFYFDGDFTITTTGDGFPPTTTVRHTNESWAIFGQGSYDLTDRFNLTAGIRYTEDDKDFTVLSGINIVPDIEVEDEKVTWDAALTYSLSDTVNVFGRVARGFRAPTIQGRNVAFFEPASSATSETTTSYEIGVKSTLLENRVRLNATAFYYDAQDLQFSAIGGAGNLNVLINADGEAWGFEADLEALVTDNFLVTAGISYNDTEITEAGLEVGACGSACTILDPFRQVPNPNAADGDGFNEIATITGNPFPQAPDWIWNITARYGIPLANGNELYFFTDWAYQGETNLFLYESAEFVTDGNLEGGARLGYSVDDGRVDMAVFARNILDAENVKGGIDFNNLTGFVNEPRIYGVSATLNF